MKKTLLFGLLFCFASLSIKAQDFIYKRNFLGEIEVYNSSFGLPQGQPISTLKVNIYGNLELSNNKNGEAFKETENVFNYRKKLVPVKPYLAPVADIVNSYNVYASSAINLQKKAESEIPQEYLNGMNASAKKEQAKASNFKMFYRSFLDKPNIVNDGWHKVIILQKAPYSSETQRNKLSSIIENGIDTILSVGFAHVNDNKINQLFWGGSDWSNTIFTGYIESRFAGGIINKGFSNLRFDTEIVELYFIDYLLDPKPLPTYPHLGGVKFNFPQKNTGESIFMFMNNVFVGGLMNYEEKDPRNMNMVNFALVMEGQYTYKIGINPPYKTGSFIVRDGQITPVNVF